MPPYKLDYDDHKAQVVYAESVFAGNIQGLTWNVHKGGAPPGRQQSARSYLLQQGGRQAVPPNPLSPPQQHDTGRLLPGPAARPSDTGASPAGAVGGEAWASPLCCLVRWRWGAAVDRGSYASGHGRG